MPELIAVVLIFLEDGLLTFDTMVLKLFNHVIYLRFSFQKGYLSPNNMQICFKISITLISNKITFNITCFKMQINSNKGTRYEF